MTLRPDSFEPDEASHFGDLPPAAQRLVLALRNLVISIWSLNPSSPVTVYTSLNFTLVRGLIRVSIPFLIERVITFLTIKG